MSEFNSEAWRRRLRLRVKRGGRLGMPHVFDAPRPRPDLSVVDGGRAREGRERAPEIIIDVPVVER